MMWNEVLKKLDKMHTPIVVAQRWRQQIQDIQLTVEKFMHSRVQNNQNYGLTHGDHREGNVLSDGKQVHLIDFDLSSLNWFTEDLFRPFFDAIVHNRTNWQDKIKPYLEGYFSIRPESSIDIAAFPWQILMKCLIGQLSQQFHIEKVRARDLWHLTIRFRPISGSFLD